MPGVIKTPQLEWVNNLRVIALFAVIILHVTSLLLMQYGKVPVYTWLIADFYNALVRFAVPVFVMITGALLLHREYELKNFLRKRLSRILWPFLFWSLVYIGYSWYNEDITFSNDAWTNCKVVLHQLQNGSFYHLWYVYMLLGLYLFMPVVSKFVSNASENEIRYFLIVWFVVMIFSQSYSSSFAPQIDGHYFTGYLGYLVLGHYLAFKELPRRNFQGWLIFLFLISLAGITWGTYYISTHDGSLSTVMFEPLGPFVVIYSASIFLLARATKFSLPASLTKFRDLIGGMSLGLYLGHALILVLIDDWLGISYKLGNPFWSIPFTALVCFILTFILVFIINKIPIIGKYISG